MAAIYGTSDSERRLLGKLPGEVRNLDDIDRVRGEFERRHAEAAGFFAGIRKWNYRRQINKITASGRDPLRAGAGGENRVVDGLPRLDQRYRVFCDLRIRLPHYVTYNGRKNLRSAQMDLIVVCPKGAFLIEIKNWGDRYTRNSGWSPHEQTERAGRVLWIVLQDAIKNVRVTNVLLSIRGNIRYDPRYRTVLVSSLYGINRFPEESADILERREMKRIIDRLRRI